ncbi:MAG: hypothetical protein NTX86_01005 [Candidatus Dependentiae bacterium]|nr:hypothetical protein [Candidatus Dependentiae bacterium]
MHYYNILLVSMLSSVLNVWGMNQEPEKKADANAVQLSHSDLVSLSTGQAGDGAHWVCYTKLVGPKTTLIALKILSGRRKEIVSCHYNVQDSRGDIYTTEASDFRFKELQKMYEQQQADMVELQNFKT